MKERKIIVVGGTAAGPSAAAKAKRTNPGADVTIYESSETISYGICEAPYAISGLIEDESKLVKYSPEKLQHEKDVEVKTLHRVEKIIPSKHKLIIRDFRTRGTFEQQYDKLIIATGSVPRCLNVPGEDGRNVFHLKNREDTQSIINYLNNEKPESAVIVGSGYIGMEMAEALRARLPEVMLLDQSSLPMEGLEEETRRRVLEELNNNGVQFIPDVAIEAFQQDGTGRVKHVITNRGAFESDIVILALGVDPNIELAKDANIRIGEYGGIITDQRMETNLDDIYAAGDCCEVQNIVTGKPIYLPLASVASRAAWVAGENAAGGHAVFKGAIRATAVKIFNLQIAQVGISSEEAIENGYKIVTDVISASSRNELMPGSEVVTIKLIVDKSTRRLLGANLFSCCGAVLRANTLAVAIQQKMSVDEIARLDLIYAPPFAPLWDPILIAANQVKKKNH
jgi:CoA-dependent NAD(P)H sulfur oxidoreductase